MLDILLIYLSIKIILVVIIIYLNLYNVFFIYIKGTAVTKKTMFHTFNIISKRILS